MTSIRQWSVQTKQVNHHSSDFTAFPLALTQSASQVQVIHLDSGSKIGLHQASIAQRLFCLSGHIKVATGNSHSQLNEGDLIEWKKGEWHETEAILPSILVIVETEQFV